jgi:hypothetical protein
MTVRRVDDETVNTCFDELISPLAIITRRANRRRDA